MYDQPIRRVLTTPPLNSQQVGDTVHLWVDDLEAFPAKLTAYESIYVPGGSTYPCWAWVEMTYGPYGELIELDGGRSGNNQSNPAFEVNSNEAAVDDIVWLRPGWNAETHGQEWLFGSRCGAGSSTSGSVNNPPLGDLDMSYTDGGDSCSLGGTTTLPMVEEGYWDTTGTSFVLNGDGGGPCVTRLTLLFADGVWSGEAELAIGYTYPLFVQVIDNDPLELWLFVDAPSACCLGGFFRVTEP